MSIGSTSFDASKPVAVFHGLTLGNGWLIRRLGAAAIPIPLLGVARLFFHRFDPARVRQSGGKGRRNWMARINALFKPLARVLFALGVRSASRPPLLRSALADAMISIAAYPVAVAAAAVLAVVSMASNDVAGGVMPIAFGLLGVMIADIPTRERRSGTTSLVYSAPMLQARFVAWKLLSTAIVAAILLIGPIVRMPTPQLAVGIVFVCAAAVFLGVASGNPKAFIVIYLTFWYLATNDHGLTPALDFTGAWGKATPAITAAYGGIAVLFALAAHGMHRRQN